MPATVTAMVPLRDCAYATDVALRAGDDARKALAAVDEQLARLSTLSREVERGRAELQRAKALIDGAVRSINVMLSIHAEAAAEQLKASAAPSVDEDAHL